MMALEIWRCDRPEEHEPHTWIKVRHGKYAEDPRLGPWRVQCYGETDPECEPHGCEPEAHRFNPANRLEDVPLDVGQRILDEPFTMADVRRSPEFVLANWFVCMWRGHRWRWLVRYRWGGRGWFAFSPVAERCSRCGIRRDPDPVRWLAQLSQWGAER
ncbi:hypothetical protein SEA_MORTYSMITH_73 [Microbacterium phage MortySmith]